MLKCNFTEDNVHYFIKIEMETSETLRVSNNGNARAFYKWIKTADS